ncbi:uncharacterized protein LOC124887702 [Capsicum annuum]|uniref:uncharacterized protein LOC124887702 n=1 Tax=Capsicum annuum TaxID=4072 RepID=UPI001FB179CE|nr:uncharacterized protein LOC124887702 [Capsicum annuum]
MQHILEANITCEIPVPPIYATEAPAFAIFATLKVSYEVDRYSILGNNVQLSEEGLIATQLENLKRAFRNMQVTRGTESLDYDDLCIHPDIDILVGYKPPKFDVFDGKGDWHAHLRAYCDKLVGVGKNEELRIKLFIQSLSGETLTWYTRQDPRKWCDWREMAEGFISLFRFNTEISPDRFLLANIQKKSFESLKEYAWHWRTETARIQPPLDEKLVKLGDFIEEGIKSGKIQSMAVLQAASKAMQTSSINVYNNQPHYNPSRASAYKNPPKPYAPVQDPAHQNRPAYAPRPHSNFEARNTHTYTPIAEPLAQLFERLRAANLLYPIEEKAPDLTSQNFDSSKRCAYHSEIQGHDMEGCYSLKNQIESLIRRAIIKCTPAAPNVNNNPLPNHVNRKFNVITLEEEYDLEEIIMPIWSVEEIATASPSQPFFTVQL